MRQILDSRLGLRRGLRLGHYFDSRATIYEATVPSTDSYGQEQKSWSIIPGHDEIPCAVGRTKYGRRSRTEYAAETVEDLAILLSGAYDLDTDMRVVVDQQYTFEIVDVTQAQTGDLTSLRVRRAT